jgi:hypothetical protein
MFFDGLTIAGILAVLSYSLLLYALGGARRDICLKKHGRAP